MLYPRMIAIAEAAMSPQRLRSWDTFKPRMTAVADRMRAKGYNTFDIASEAGNRTESLHPIRAFSQKPPCHLQYPLVEQVHSRRSHHTH